MGARIRAVRLPLGPTSERYAVLEAIEQQPICWGGARRRKRRLVGDSPARAPVARPDFGRVPVYGIDSPAPCVRQHVRAGAARA